MNVVGRQVAEIAPGPTSQYQNPWSPYLSRPMRLKAAWLRNKYSEAHEAYLYIYMVKYQSFQIRRTITRSADGLFAGNTGRFG